MREKELLWEKQNGALRHPSEIFGASYENSGITADSLKFTQSKAFAKLLFKTKATLIISREYENLLIALHSSDGKKIKQSFFHVPHPSGMAADHVNNKLYVAATRNPNQIIEFGTTQNSIKRIKIKSPKTGVLIPARSKYYPGQYYFHDLVLHNGNLYANSVGMNCVIKADLSRSQADKPLWWPKCIERDGKPDFTANYIQLNSIAIGKDFKDAYFSASAIQPSSRRPGQLNFPVDKRGVIFSGRTRKAEFKGLTRPHSARFYKGKIWVANSGYGEVGYFERDKYTPAFKFKGWTRGLCFMDDILFVGISRVLPRFRHYAPGIHSQIQTCAVAAIDLKRQKVIGEIRFPFGNQIFAIEYLDSRDCVGFPFTTPGNKSSEADIFSVSV